MAMSKLHDRLIEKPDKVRCGGFWVPQRKTVMSIDAELLVGLSHDELKALADSILAPSAQSRLNDLLEKNTENPIGLDEQAELDCLLAKVDQLTILRTRARYTLRQQAGAMGR